jgi:hypothetical protein
MENVLVLTDIMKILTGFARNVMKHVKLALLKIQINIVKLVTIIII